MESVPFKFWASLMDPAVVVERVNMGRWIGSPVVRRDGHG